MPYTTGRLILRGYTQEDKFNLFRLFNEKFVASYMYHINANIISDVEEHIDFILQNAESQNRTHYFFVVELQEIREFLGIIGYALAEETETGSVMELEYYLLEEHWGKGYMTEALAKILQIAFDSGRVAKIFGQCHVENASSANVMVKCGMKKSAIQPPPKMYNGVLKENARYEIMAGWKAGDCININNIRLATKRGLVITEHIKQRMRQRKIEIADIRQAIHTGEIIELYLDRKPYPACLITDNNIHVVVAINNGIAYLVTCYFPDAEHFDEDMKIRKRKD